MTNLPDYSEILAFLAENPPEAKCERDVHASMLELLATSLRTDTPAEPADQPSHDLRQLTAKPFDVRDLMPVWASRAS